VSNRGGPSDRAGRVASPCLLLPAGRRVQRNGGRGGHDIALPHPTAFLVHRRRPSAPIVAPFASSPNAVSPLLISPPSRPSDGRPPPLSTASPPTDLSTGPVSHAPRPRLSRPLPSASHPASRSGRTLQAVSLPYPVQPLINTPTDGLPLDLPRLAAAAALGPRPFARPSAPSSARSARGRP
jgi:hypothetical protein